MLSHKFKFLRRGMSMSEGKKSEMDHAGTKIRASSSTYPAETDEMDLPMGEIARRAIDNLPAIHLQQFKKLSYKPLTEFPRFNELPLKVRLIIIRMLFYTDRDIRLRVQYPDVEYKAEDFGFPLPVSFFVNREFRRESQKYFYFFSQTHAFQGTGAIGLKKDPYCYAFNPKFDKISVNFQSLWSHTYSMFLREAFQQIPDCFREIHVLEIVDVCESGFVLMSAHEEVFENFLRDNIARFHYLNEIRFVVDNTDVLETRFVYLLMDEVNEAFQKEKKILPYCRLPKLVCIAPH